MKPFSKKKAIGITLVVIVIILSFPGYVIYKTIRNDHALNEHIKNKLIPNIKTGLSLYFNSEEEPVLPVIELYIDKPELENLEKQIVNKIEQGKKQSIFGSNSFTFVDAKIVDDKNGEHKIKIRIRGDMSSNFNHGLENATYRFNIIDSSFMYGKKKLSLVRPFLENHGFYGYLFYKYFKNEQLISNDIRFVNLKFNSEDIGVYMLQEGFSEELILSNDRKGGILLRFKDDCSNYYNSYSELVPYQKKKVLADSTLLSQLDIARTNFDEVIKGDQSPSNCFNIDLYAKYFALCDIFMSHHSYTCFNAKFWFNPNNQLLEPIAWDPANFVRYKSGLDLSYKGHNYTFDSVCNNKYRFPIHYILRKDSSFLSRYTEYLYHYAHNHSIQNFIESYSNEIKKLEPLLFKQNYETVYHPEWIIERMDEIKRLFLASNVVQASYYKERNVLKVKSMTQLPIYIKSISFSDTIININQMLLPQQEKEIQVFLDIKGVDIPSQFKLISSFLYPKKELKYKGIVF